MIKKIKRMKFKFPLIMLVLIAGTLLISGCAGNSQATATGWPGLSVDGETAYLAHNRHIYAINLSNGLERWRFPVEQDNKRSFYSTPTLTTDGQLLAGSYEFILYSLDPASGVEKWSSEDADDRYIAAPLATEQGIFAPNANNTLYALDLQGNQRWVFPTTGPLWATPATDPDCECIYLPSMDHKLYSIEAQSGDTIWLTEDLGGSIVGTPAYDTGRLYFGTFANELIALDASDGKTIWRAATSNWVWGGPIVRDGVLYVGDLDGTFYALDAATGSVIWQQKFDGAITQSPLVTEDTLYFTTEAGSVYALNLNGTTLWTKNLGHKLFTSPVQAGDLILIAPSAAEEFLIAFNADGAQQWVYIPEEK
jgi:outer membrane protein assembly factor BamB